MDCMEEQEQNKLLVELLVVLVMLKKQSELLDKNN
jgi:hypothetical protein